MLYWLRVGGETCQMRHAIAQRELRSGNALAYRRQCISPVHFLGKCAGEDCLSRCHLVPFRQTVVGSDRCNGHFQFCFFTVTSCYRSYEVRQPRWSVLESWNLENLKSWSLEILKSWNLEILKSWNLKSLKSWNLEILKSWNLEILESWNIEILKSWNLEILKT